MKKLLAFIALFMTLSAAAQYSAADSVAAFHRSVAENSGAIPQEMIYLHLDNTSYYRGDRIYFACYLVTSGDLKPSNLSQTVYVELLNPSGKVIDKCVLKAVDGRCHGSLLANETPFYSGYYEIRAYTRYMLNFGEEAIFSRVIPIFKEDGTMLKYGARERTFNRPKPTKGDKVTAKFYPEGGHMVAGLPATVGYELTDETRRPLQGTGRVVDRKTDSIVADIATDSMGRGTVRFTPQAGSKYRADFMVGGKKYSVDLPKAEAQGMALSVDNLTNPDSVRITVSRSEGFPTEIVGASITCRGQLYGRAILDLADERTATFSFPAAKLPTGVGMVTLFDANGTTIADRLFFNNKHDMATIDYEFDKSQYAPHELITIKTTSTTPFSISVTDADNQVAYGSNIFADLLLASEIKGYVHNPAWYFEGEGREAALDRLLLIQGWRKYPWSTLAGITPYDITVLPEQGIEVHGTVTNANGKPQKDVTVSALVQEAQVNYCQRRTLYIDEFTTDSEGKFAFRVDVDCRCLLTISASRKGKLKPYVISLNLSKHPDIRPYDISEMAYETVSFIPNTVTPIDSMTLEETMAEPNSHQLKEVEVTAKATPWDRGQIISKAVVSYDVGESFDDIVDNTGKSPRTFPDLLTQLDPDFNFPNAYCAYYKGKYPIFYVEGGINGLGMNGPKNSRLVGNYDPFELPIEAIEKVYINNENAVVREYVNKIFQKPPPGWTLMEWRNHMQRKCSAVVLIEVSSMLCGPMQRGMRLTYINGYTEPKEFYSPDYSDGVPDEDDHRRTLYWNHSVEPCSALRFYNNSTACKFNVSTATFPFNP